MISTVVFVDHYNRILHPLFEINILLKHSVVNQINFANIKKYILFQY